MSIKNPSFNLKHLTLHEEHPNIYQHSTNIFNGKTEKKFLQDTFRTYKNIHDISLVIFCFKKGERSHTNLRKYLARAFHIEKLTFRPFDLFEHIKGSRSSSQKTVTVTEKRDSRSSFKLPRMSLGSKNQHSEPEEQKVIYLPRKDDIRRVVSKILENSGQQKGTLIMCRDGKELSALVIACLSKTINLSAEMAIDWTKDRVFKDFDQKVGYREIVKTFSLQENNKEYVQQSVPEDSLPPSSLSPRYQERSLFLDNTETKTKHIGRSVSGVSLSDRTISTKPHSTTKAHHTRSLSSEGIEALSRFGSPSSNQTVIIKESDGKTGRRCCVLQ